MLWAAASVYDPWALRGGRYTVRVRGCMFLIQQFSMLQKWLTWLDFFRGSDEWGSFRFPFITASTAAMYSRPVWCIQTLEIEKKHKYLLCTTTSIHIDNYLKAGPNYSKLCTVQCFPNRWRYPHQCGINKHWGNKPKQCTYNVWRPTAAIEHFSPM